MKPMVSVASLVTLQAMAFWPVWHWYGERMLDGSDEPWGILALLATLVIVGFRRRALPLGIAPLIGCLFLTSIYITGFGRFPQLVLGGLAALSAALVISATSYGRFLQPAVAGLLVLSLPIIASLQFFGGFPLRFMTTWLVASLLSALGLPVDAQGTLLIWAGETIAVDAPCAGIKMLWSGLFLNFAFAAWTDLGIRATWWRTNVTMACVFFGNVLRATALFFTESGLVAAPDFAHAGIGIVVFVGVALMICFIHAPRRGAELCAS